MENTIKGAEVYDVRDNVIVLRKRPSHSNKGYNFVVLRFNQCVKRDFYVREDSCNDVALIDTYVEKVLKSFDDYDNNA